MNVINKIITDLIRHTIDRKEQKKTERRAEREKPNKFIKPPKQEHQETKEKFINRSVIFQAFDARTCGLDADVPGEAAQQLEEAQRRRRRHQHQQPLDVAAPRLLHVAARERSERRNARRRVARRHVTQVARTRATEIHVKINFTYLHWWTQFNRKIFTYYETRKYSQIMKPKNQVWRFSPKIYFFTNDLNFLCF